jgi:D-cysteine desulfhydrase
MRIIFTLHMLHGILNPLDPVLDIGLPAKLWTRQQRKHTMIPLFEEYPELRARVPYLPLADLPTPVQRLAGLGTVTGLRQLYIKRDDLTGKAYGGNKVRKLEFFLGDALRRGAREVMTFGFAGSNHATATAIYARRVGLRSISMLTPQHNAAYVRRNLLLGHASGAELHHYPSEALLRIGQVYQLLWHSVQCGRIPMVIPPGGTSPLGTMAYVNAALELKQQIDRGLLPEPDRIYAAMGTAGTVVGLIIGLKAAGLASRVVPVRIAEYSIVPQNQLAKHYAQTVAFLSRVASSFPTSSLSQEEAKVVEDMLGQGYARFTKEGMAAVHLMAKAEGIPLDGTYMGKVLAALLRDARVGWLQDKVILFWNTLNSQYTSEWVSTIDYHRLPRAFHRYFEQQVQPLDEG